MSRKVINVIIVLSILTFLVSGLIFWESEREFAITKADKITAGWSNSIYEQENANEAFQKVDTRRKICIGFMIGSPILLIIGIYLKCSPQHEDNPLTINNIESTENKLKELQKLKESKLITEDEYNIKRKDILNKI